MRVSTRQPSRPAVQKYRHCWTFKRFPKRSSRRLRPSGSCVSWSHNRSSVPAHVDTPSRVNVDHVWFCGAGNVWNATHCEATIWPLTLVWTWVSSIRTACAPPWVRLRLPTPSARGGFTADGVCPCPKAGVGSPSLPRRTRCCCSSGRWKLDKLVGWVGLRGRNGQQMVSAASVPRHEGSCLREMSRFAAVLAGNV